MALTTQQLAEYTQHIDSILDKSDLTTVSVKKIRTTLQSLIGPCPEFSSGDLKPVINGLIQERFTVAEDRASIKHEQEEDDEPPAKKRKVKEEVKDDVEIDGEDKDADEKLAALLQAEENKSSGRATRGARAAKAAPMKAPVKRKKKEKVEEEPEYDSEGNEIRKVKKGAFHKEYLLSEPLGVLVGGETQLSRPQTVKKIWEHIKANNLQVPTDKRQINCDDKMRAVFKQDQVHMFTMNKLLGKHFYPLPGEEEMVLKEKKPKVVREKKTVVKKVKVKSVAQKEKEKKSKKKSEVIVNDEDESDMEEDDDAQYAKSEDEISEDTPAETPTESTDVKEESEVSKKSTPASEED